VIWFLTLAAIFFFSPLLTNFELKSTLSDIHIATPAFSQIPFFGILLFFLWWKNVFVCDICFFYTTNSWILSFNAIIQPAFLIGELLFIYWVMIGRYANSCNFAGYFFPDWFEYCSLSSFSLIHFRGLIRWTFWFFPKLFCL
jgi:hypothetical protein